MMTPALLDKEAQQAVVSESPRVLVLNSTWCKPCAADMLACRPDRPRISGSFGKSERVLSRP
jgi:hypothetical protein